MLEPLRKQKLWNSGQLKIVNIFVLSHKKWNIHGIYRLFSVIWALVQCQRLHSALTVYRRLLRPSCQGILFLYRSMLLRFLSSKQFAKFTSSNYVQRLFQSCLVTMYTVIISQWSSRGGTWSRQEHARDLAQASTICPRACTRSSPGRVSNQAQRVLLIVRGIRSSSLGELTKIKKIPVRWQLFMVPLISVECHQLLFHIS